MFRLMVKTHNITGLKYLCITKRDDWEKYTGSGVRWNKHLNKHGANISTELIFETDDYDEFVKECIRKSVDLDIVFSDDYANSVPEIGYNTDTEFSNLELWWMYASDEEKQEIYDSRSLSMKEYWSNLDENSRLEHCKNISNSLSEYWSNLDDSIKYEKMAKLWVGGKKFHSEKNTVKYEKFRNNVGKASSERWAKMTQDERSDKVREIRLNTSEESKLRRKKKIQALYATGKFRPMFDKMSKDRMGSGNPNAKSICVNGIVYGSVQEASRELGIPAHRLYAKRRKQKNENIEI